MTTTSLHKSNFSLPNTDEKPLYVQNLFKKVAKYYDIMNDCMSFGMHRQWKKEACKRLQLPPNAQVLDVCCGTGDLALYLNKACPTAKITGLDFCQDMLDIAVTRNDLKDLNATFIQGDALNLPFEDNSFDGVVISYGLRNVADYQRCLLELHRVIKPGGHVVILDMSHPNKIMGAFSAFYRFKVMPLIGRIIANDPDSYRYLSNSIFFYLTQSQLVEEMQKAGLNSVSYKNMMGGICALHWGQK